MSLTRVRAALRPLCLPFRCVQHVCMRVVHAVGGSLCRVCMCVCAVGYVYVWACMCADLCVVCVSYGVRYVSACMACILVD